MLCNHKRFFLHSRSVATYSRCEFCLYIRTFVLLSDNEESMLIANRAFRQIILTIYCNNYLPQKRI